MRGSGSRERNARDRGALHWRIMPQGQFPHPDLTAWHITVGTARARLHGGSRATVDRVHNQRGRLFVEHDEWREYLIQLSLTGEPVLLNDAHRAFIEQTIPSICARGGWTFHVCAAPPPPENDHFHVLLDAPKAVHGKQIRSWLKRWLTEALNERFDGPPDGREAEGPSAHAKPPRPWWVEGGSTKPVKDASYFVACFDYDRRQRSTPFVLEVE